MTYETQNPISLDRAQSSTAIFFKGEPTPAF